jgi:hypothetical protein
MPEVDFIPPSQGLRIWPLDFIWQIFAGTPLKPEYTQENLPLVEAGFCNLRKQVIIAKIIEK